MAQGCSRKVTSAIAQLHFHLFQARFSRAAPKLADCQDSILCAAILRLESINLDIKQWADPSDLSRFQLQLYLSGQL